MLLLVILYSCAIALLPVLPPKAVIALHFVHACAWCLFHCFGLGLLLRAQSESKFIVRHFLKNYHYPYNDEGTGAIQEAFTNWKSLYNLSLCMTYGKFSLSQGIMPDSIVLYQLLLLGWYGRPTRFPMIGPLDMNFFAIL